MTIDLKIFRDIITKNFDSSVNRLLQSSCIYASVWLTYAKEISKGSAVFRADLILTPHFRSSAAEVFKVLYDIAANKGTLSEWELATNGETVAVKLTFEELIHDVLPLSSWWSKVWQKTGNEFVPEFIREQEWLNLMVGAVLLADAGEAISDLKAETIDRIKSLGRDFIGAENLDKGIYEDAILYSVSLNRTAGISISHSVPCTKADAGRRLFDVDGTDVTWAVVDTGIDAAHPVFRKLDKGKQIIRPALLPDKERMSNNTRVIATYDFTNFRKLICDLSTGKPEEKQLPANLPTSDQRDQSLTNKEKERSVKTIGLALQTGRMLDWSELGPMLRIPHNEENYKKPEHSHGTHVAGIIGAGLPEGSGDDIVLVGMCPRINLYDFRVLDHQGRGNEFNIIAALQFIRWINQNEGFNIHGVNLSMSLYHDVETYACGHTPVCVSANRLVEEGVVVVAAAGNLGQTNYDSANGNSQGFRTVNITDPGNAEDVITVGATHRNEPHRYGVSYFSSKGPTGDGRIKPDLVAPGEKISSSVLNDGIDVMDGTSMAAPHVSGAAALVMAKHRELIGRPRRIKDILCGTATDLGRERYFQGCGMIDVLRAMQSV